MRKMLLGLIAAMTVLTFATAQDNLAKFRWQADQKLTYRVEQQTTIKEVVGDKTTSVANKLNLVKQWHVKDVDADGAATLELFIVSMKNQITRPDGEVISYDSADADKSSAEMKEQMGKFIGVSLATIRVDTRGLVVEVKESKHGPASRFESDLPFKLALAAVKLEPGTAWKRPYQITLAPPQGTGEKYDASQKYTCKTVDADRATFSFETTLGKPPEAVLDQVPLLQMQPEGEVVFDLRAGVVLTIRQKIDRELKGHQGEGSSYQFQTNYVEEFVAPK